MHPNLKIALGVVLGLVSGSAVTFAATRPSSPKVEASAEPSPSGASSSPDSALAEANARLVAQIAECDRRLVELGQPPVPTASLDAEAPTADEPRGRRDRDGGRRGPRGEPTKEDWERMAESATLRVRMPCVRDTPWKPNEATLDRLGLSPDDGETIRAAYAESNKRMLAEVRPLCGKVLGSPDVLDKVGADTCIDAILNAGRRQSPEAAKSAIVTTAEVNAGKRAPEKDPTDPMTRLLAAMTHETRAFEADLAKKLGPEEAKRLAWAPEMCADRRVVRPTDEPVQGGFGGRGGGGGGGRRQGN
jgi:hypothetical protein